MTRPTHRLAAVALAVAAAPVSLEVAAVAAAGAMLPDQAELHRDRRDPDSGWCRHRTVTHSLLWPGLVFFALGSPSEPFAVGVAVALAAHGLADAVTLDGAGLLWPVVRRPVRLLPDLFAFKTGYPAECYGARVALLALIAVLAGPIAALAAWAFAFLPSIPRLLRRAVA